MINWKSSLEKNSATIFLSLLVIAQISAVVWIFFVDVSDSESFNESAAQNYLVIQVDDTGEVVRKWDIEKATFTNRGGSWIFKKEKSRVVLSPMKNYIFFENPTKEERRQFLSVDKE